MILFWFVFVPASVPCLAYVKQQQKKKRKKKRKIEFALRFFFILRLRVQSKGRLHR